MARAVRVGGPQFAHDARTIPADDPAVILGTLRDMVAAGAMPYPARLCVDGSPERGTFTDGYLAVARVDHASHRQVAGRLLCQCGDERACWLARYEMMRAMLTT